jgi:hypothetical protein
MFEKSASDIKIKKERHLGNWLPPLAGRPFSFASYPFE